MNTALSRLPLRFEYGLHYASCAFLVGTSDEQNVIGELALQGGEAAREYVQALLGVETAQEQDDSLPFQSRESVQELGRVWEVVVGSSINSVGSDCDGSVVAQPCDTVFLR